MEDPPEELSGEEASLRDVHARVSDLLDTLRALVATREDAARWFRLWSPVVAALGRLGVRLTTLGVRLRTYLRDPEAAAALDESDRDAIIDELRALAHDFPNLVDILVGLHHVDELVDAMRADEPARAAARRVLDALAGVIERFVSRFVDLALGDTGDAIGPEHMLAFLQRFEDVAQELLDRWVPRGLGMASSVIYEEE